MKRQGLLRACVLLTLMTGTLLIGSCGGNSTLNDDEAAVYLAFGTFDYGNYYVSVCANEDAFMTSMIIHSHPKDPTSVILGNAQDVTLTRWEATPYRLDGGTVASPQWVHDMDLHVSAGSTGIMLGWPVYPAENYDQPPLSYLLPENGGVDPETGERSIRQSIRLEVFGRTNAGKSVSAEIILEFNFACSW